MRFENWWHSKYPASATKEAFDLMREAWEAATLAEREACAKVCETHTVDDVLVGVGIAKSCAAMIRARSNAGVTGAEPKA